MTDAPVKRRRRFRFGLRTLLAVVTVAAVASWGYLVGWPLWRIYCEQMSIERAAKQLKHGMTSDEISQALTEPGHWASRTNVVSDGPDCRGEIHFDTGNAVYFVYFELQGEGDSDTKTPCKSIQVFRFRRVLADTDTVCEAHASDFFEFMSSGKTKPGFQYELIYSDPPAKPAAK
jgi:hypothetical protein